ncbi:hypothetical protein [Oceanobacillus timonensis]|uniref:hypothetical protein n=1 Tax=Oceanobacillus timonensis TaxID=1926285 RepID=UPI0009BB28D0|nr:hypothetical protein [Oceanobacillus timonensis]
MIRHRLIDTIRKDERAKERLAKFKQQYQVDTTSGNYRNPTGVNHLLIEEEEAAGMKREMNRAFWKQVRSLLTKKQWK